MGGFSKAYAMTGWRVGYVAAPAAILEGIVKVHQYGIMSAPTIAQDAALVALVEGEPDVERMLAEYDRRRRLLVDGLNALGLETFEPRGAFYAFPRITSTGLTADDVHRAPAHRGARRGRPGRVPSGRPAPATSGCATRPRTSGSRRPSPDRAVRGARPPDAADRRLRRRRRRARRSQAPPRSPRWPAAGDRGCPEVAVGVVGLGRPEPEAPLVRHRRRAAGRLPALVDQAATDHERRQRVGRADPDLGRLLARRVDRAVRAHPVDRAHPAAREAAARSSVDRPQGGLDPVGAAAGRRARSRRRTTGRRAGRP